MKLAKFKISIKGSNDGSRVTEFKNCEIYTLNDYLFSEWLKQGIIEPIISEKNVIETVEEKQVRRGRPKKSEVNKR